MDKLNTSLILSIFVTTGCMKLQQKQSITWSEQQNLPIPEIIGKVNFDKTKMNVQMLDSQVVRSPQTFLGVEIEDTFLQKIISDDGNLQYLQAEYYPDEKLKNLKFEIQDYEKNKYPRLLNFKNKYPNFFKDSQILDFKTIILFENQKPFVVYKIAILEDLSAQEIYFDHASNIIKKKITVSEFDQINQNFARAQVFPKGPALSDLKEVILDQVFQNGELKNKYLSISSQTGEKVFSPNLVFIYPPEDKKFDHVQVYHFIEKEMEWFEKNLNFKLPFPLSIELHVGEPEKKTNAAFYYHGNIRLGSGDDVTYKQIPKDPSIVMHEAGHAIVDAISGLPFEGQGGSINEAFADFFAATVLDHPNMGEASYLKGPFKRSLDNPKLVKDANGGLYHDSLILSATFWDIKKSIGSEKAADLAFKTLARLGPNGQFSQVKSSVVDSLKNFTTSDQTVVLNILKNRGWE